MKYLERGIVPVDKLCGATRFQPALLGIDIHLHVHVDNFGPGQLLESLETFLILCLSGFAIILSQVLVQNVGVVVDPTAADRHDEKRRR